ASVPVVAGGEQGSLGQQLAQPRVLVRECSDLVNPSDLVHPGDTPGLPLCPAALIRKGGGLAGGPTSAVDLLHLAPAPEGSVIAEPRAAASFPGHGPSVCNTPRHCPTPSTGAGSNPHRRSVSLSSSL